MYGITFPTAASPNKTSFTLLLGFGADAVVSAISGHTFKMRKLQSLKKWWGKLVSKQPVVEEFTA
jgi:hypothetical protein